MTKNKMSDLNNHLFAQLERLAVENMTLEQIESEVKRTDAIVSLADQVSHAVFSRNQPHIVFHER